MVKSRVSRDENSWEVSLFDFKLLLRAAMIGAAMHIAFVLIQAVFPAVPKFIGLSTTMYVVLMISGIAGFRYARDLDRGYNPGAMGGLLVGMVSAFAGLALGVVLQIPPAFPLGLGTVIGTGIGAVGGVWGQMRANMRKVTGR